AAGCGDGSPAGPAESGYAPPLVTADARGRAAARLDRRGQVQVRSARFPEGVGFAVTDSTGHAVAGLDLEYAEGPDSLVIARVTAADGAWRPIAFAGNPARLAVAPEAADGDSAVPRWRVRLTARPRADLPPYYAGPTYISVQDQDLVLGQAALDRIALSDPPECGRLGVTVARLRADGGGRGGITLSLAGRRADSTGTALVAGLTAAEPERFSAEALLDRVRRFAAGEWGEEGGEVGANTLVGVRSGTGLGDLLPEYGGRHLDLSPGKEAGCGSGVREMTAELPGGLTMSFVWIETGTFSMGSAPAVADSEPASDEEPTHEVTIDPGFWLGQYEVTQAQWEAVMGTRPWDSQSRVEPQPDRPAVFLSWEDARQLAARLNERAGEALYRLPTEAEWEFACRAGTATTWSFGDDEADLGEYAWYFDNAWDEGLTAAQQVGRRRPSPWGLYDMHGNVAEWCQDWYGPYPASSELSPVGPATGTARVTRGGSFSRFARFTRSADRLAQPPGYQYYDLGARLVRGR
ncbi:MAG: formylglycine-generating enzyme family protein, partial [Gemmatimonadota bacterium]